MTDETPLPSDDLGDWAEHKFGELCAARSLVANKATRDKMGWDYLVELPPEPGAALPLDQRPNALRCRVQLKAHWRRDGARVPLTLSAAERLAKDPGPAFVLAMTVDPGTADDDPVLVECHLIHMTGENLARVLKRLREAHADPKAKGLADQTITFDPATAGELLKPTGNAIRNALLRASGDDPHAYIAAKGKALKSLGYAAGRYKLNAKVQAASLDEFVELMLGLRQAEVSDLQAFDTRFGVEVAVDHFDKGVAMKALFKPNPVDTCTIRVRGAGLSAPAVFQGTVLFPPLPKNFPDASRRILFRTSYFDFDMHGSGKLTFNLMLPKLLDATLPLAEWREHLRLLQILAEEKIEVDIEGDALGTPHQVIPLNLATPHGQEPWVSEMVAIVSQADDLLRMAGAKGEPITLRQLSETAQSIVNAHARLFDPSLLPPQTFTTEGRLDPALPVSDLDMLMIDYVVVAGASLAYACRLSMRPESAGEGLLWRQVDFRPHKIATIDATIPAFQAFENTVRTETGIQNVMIRDLGLDDNHTAS